MSFGLTMEKLVVIGIIAAFVVGPERLPRYAAQLASLVRRLRELAKGAESRLRDEVGDDVDLSELRVLDPRTYDPRRILRDALVDDEVSAPKAARVTPRRRAMTRDTFDGEAT